MDTNKKNGFVLVNGSYQEAPTNELVENGRWKPGYENRRFVKLHGNLLEVDEKTYRDYQRQRRREKYLAEEAELHNEFSYNAADCAEYSGEELIVDILTNVEDEVIHNRMVEMVADAVENLPSSDYDLIHALYFDGLTEREYQDKSGLPQKTINNRRRRILRYLKKVVGDEK